MSGLLFKVRGDTGGFRSAAANAFGAAEVEVEEILTVPPEADAIGLSATEAKWLRVSAPDESENPWDEAHAAVTGGAPFGVAGAGVEVVEPDIVQRWHWWETPGDEAAFAASGETCEFDEQDGDGGRATGPGPAWQLGDDYSQLGQARDRVGAKQRQIRIAHLDTGLDPRHTTLPLHTLRDIERNFVRGEDAGNATDLAGDGVLSNRGHGIGTMSILAGNRVAANTPGFTGFEGFLGGAPEAEILPVRIADWVVRFALSSMVQGIDYARQNGAHVLSMSMGGVSSQALVDAVNHAYDAGVVLVTAGGNNLSGIPSPRSIVYPARLRRVIAACGLMADGRAYSGLAFRQMQGNFGPREKMFTALGAYTPNVPWAQIGCGNIVDMDGGGTSAATPQVAAAAALWLAEHWDEVSAYPKPWMRVEAVRRALFESARKSTPRMSEAETFQKIGQGVVQAAAALAERPAAAASLQKLDPGESTWPWLSLLFGRGGLGLTDDPRRRMLALELTQMAQKVAEVDAAVPAPEEPISPAGTNRYLEAALDAGKPSRPLKQWLEAHLGREAKPATAATRTPPVRRKMLEPEPPRRRLRIYALDPSAAKELETIDVNEAIAETPWDDEPVAPDRLRPGPVGEYLEIVDVDPVTGKAYAPVDLNDAALLAQSGLAPSEGNPKFHQQMVYAVAMKTIGHFESALGRAALWAPRDVDDEVKAIEVRRLRIYPHALREANAYYSPSKKALLFGYFQSRRRDGVSGTMVFTCLSSDIIAHEMSHALLDGLHRRYQEASNPDVRAFHEGFADIVAVFQHFTVGELVRFEIARARGDLSAATLLSGLARQFGRTSGIGDALRSYSGGAVKQRSYQQTTDVHDRGETLVLAVYDAFLAIVGRRTKDLIRLATGGTGVLQPGAALHADLVNRLADETCQAASHVLNICIRALDYCPPVDITFGDYLRALITADFELVPDDTLGYRVAFIEAFQARGIPVRGVRTMSTESLLWNAPAEDRPDWLKPIFRRVDISLTRRLTRSQIFDLNEKNRGRVKEALAAALEEDDSLCAQFGLMKRLPTYSNAGEPLGEPPGRGTTFEVSGVRPARRVGPDGNVRTDIIAVVTQRRPELLDPDDPGRGFFWFRGGTTLVLDGNLGEPCIRYNIVKNSSSERRLGIQRKSERGGFAAPLRAHYFGEETNEPFALMHAGLRGKADG